MKAPSPAFSFYPKDALTDENVAAMTDEELGFYMRLLCHAWLEGSVPADLLKMARMLKRPLRTVQRLWPAIAPCWEEAEGRLTQRRLEAVRAQQLAFRDRQSAKGIKSGKARVSNKSKQPRLNRGSRPVGTGGEPNTNLPFPSPFPSSTPTTNEQRTTECAEDGPAPFPSQRAADVYLRHYPSGKPPGPMFKALRPLVAKHGWPRVEPELEGYLLETDVQFHNWPKFASGFGSWSNGRARVPDRASAAAVTVGAMRQILSEEAEKRDRQGDVHGGLGGDGAANQQAGRAGAPRRLPPGVS